MSTGKSQVASRGTSRVASSQIAQQRGAFNGEGARDASAMLKFPTPMSTHNAAKQEISSNNPGRFLNNSFSPNYNSQQSQGYDSNKITKSGYSLGSGSTNASLSGRSQEVTLEASGLGSGLQTLQPGQAQNSFSFSSNNQKRKFGSPGVILPPMQGGSQTSSLPPKRTPNGGRNSRQQRLAQHRDNKSEITLGPLVTGGSNALSMSGTASSGPQISFPISPDSSGIGSFNLGRVQNRGTSQPPKSVEMSALLSGSLYTGNPLAAPPNIDPTKIILPKHDPTKCSTKRNGIIRAYAANTNQGIIRNYNEDRVSIILNIMKPQNKQCDKWPKCSFFGVYDGHGGASCADYLRDNLHHFVVKDDAFPSNPREALKNGFAKAEQSFLEQAEKKAQTNPALLDKSGSCAVSILLVQDMCYVANVGDSRAILSSDGGKKCLHLTQDHRPSEESEQKRIIEYGGKIYQTQTMAKIPTTINGIQIAKNQFLVGPYRVLPGRLSVSRTFGDIEAKLSKYGGKFNVISAAPEIISLRIRKEHDFIVLACDGIFDKLTSNEVVKTVWAAFQNQNLRQPSVHQQCGISIEMILKSSVARKTLDNITAVMVAFYNFKKMMQIHQYPQDTEFDINSQHVPEPLDVIMPDEGDAPDDDSEGRGRKLSSTFIDEDDEEVTPPPKSKRTQFSVGPKNSFAQSMPKNQGSFIGGNLTHDIAAISGQSHFSIRGGGKVPPSANQSERGSIASGYQRKFHQGSSKSTMRPRLGGNSSGLGNFSTSVGHISDDQQLPRHLSPSSLNHVPNSLRTPLHARQLATIDNPQGMTPQHQRSAAFSNSYISPKRGGAISNSVSKKTSGLLSRGSHMSGVSGAGGSFDRSEVIGNSYSPLARRNSSNRRDTMISASSQLDALRK